MNRSSGDVVVSNIVNTSGGPGNLELFKGGTGSGIALTNSYMYEYYFPAYDGSGNIYADGLSSSFSYLLVRCAPGSSNCPALNVSGATLSTSPGGINWDGADSELILGDQQCGRTQSSCWYATEVSGSVATATGTTSFLSFDGTACDLVQGALGPFSKFAVGGCSAYGTYASAVDRWPYPAGGSSTTYNNSVDAPVGAAISNKTIRNPE